IRNDQNSIIFHIVSQNKDSTVYVAIGNPHRLLIDLLYHSEKRLGGLFDMGSDINLISEEAVSSMGIPKHLLKKPTRISLSLHNHTSTPILLQYFFTATLIDWVSVFVFLGVQFKNSSILQYFWVINATNQSEQLILQEFQDLFPADIPEISEEEESEGLLTDGSF
ncbi:hypothetical protein VP01_6207g1, partial [Puccinia sorghi]